MINGPDLSTGCTLRYGLQREQKWSCGNWVQTRNQNAAESNQSQFTIHHDDWKTLNNDWHPCYRPIRNHSRSLKRPFKSLKISSGANPYEMAHWGSVVFLCAVFCAKSAQNTQKEKCRPLIGHWRPYAASSLVKSPVFAECSMQIVTLLDVTLYGAERKMLIWGPHSFI